MVINGKTRKEEEEEAARATEGPWQVGKYTLVTKKPKANDLAAELQDQLSQHNKEVLGLRYMMEECVEHTKEVGLNVMRVETDRHFVLPANTLTADEEWKAGGDGSGGIVARQALARRREKAHERVEEFFGMFGRSADRQREWALTPRLVVISIVPRIRPEALKRF